MISVNFKSRILQLTQSRKKDMDYEAFKNVHQGLTTLQNSLQNLKIKGENLNSVDSNNSVFPFKNKPSVVNVNGVVQTEGTDFSYQGNNVIFFSPVASNSVVSTHFLSND